MRFSLGKLITWMVWGAAALAWAGPAAAQSGFDRIGGDYLKFEIRNGDPEVCASRCEQDSRCRAWTFSYPRTETRYATCWLKNKVTPRTESNCCISGVRGAGIVEPRTGPIEFSIDRFGGDYRFVDLPPDGNGQSCQEICKGEDRCRAWTFVRAGYISIAPRCYLKDKITRPKAKPCCISGVVK